MASILAAKVFHARMRPRRNAFRYGATYIAISIGELVSRRAGLFSIDRRNLFALRTADYGDGEPAAWIARILRDWNVHQADGDVTLVTMPRVFGYAFNPVNFWFCHDAGGGLRAVVAEVNNTFGERHSYLCVHEDRREIAARDVLTARKIFHVSPFLELEGEYLFSFAVTGKSIGVAIDLADEGGVLLRTSVAGPLSPLTSARLLRALLANPLMPLKVIALIHYQAVKLFFKRVPHLRKPPPPVASISR
ncbi:MAG TPA: DUF1365 domain-containing protein [Rhizomicrobium sp.]|nr:DUF1365 domain-containing protein [Rhizomicrobium sp.]